MLIRPGCDERDHQQAQRSNKCGQRPSNDLYQQRHQTLRAESDRRISFGDLAALAASECCACGLASTPTVCADCPNLHLLHAVARHDEGGLSVKTQATACWLVIGWKRRRRWR